MSRARVRHERPWSDPSVTLDPVQGLPPLRRDWILKRGDVDEIEDESLGQLMMAICLTSTRLSLRNAAQHSMEPARPRAANHCAHPRSSDHPALVCAPGIITPEMEFIAIRENGRYIENRESRIVQTVLRTITIHELRFTEFARLSHPGSEPIANCKSQLANPIIPNSSAPKWRAGAPSFLRINHPESEPMIIGRNFLVKINANIGTAPWRRQSRKKSRKCVGRRNGAPTR